MKYMHEVACIQHFVYSFIYIHVQKKNTNVNTLEMCASVQPSNLTLQGSSSWGTWKSSVVFTKKMIVVKCGDDFIE